MITFDVQQGWVFWIATAANVIAELPKIALMPKIIRPLIRRIAKELVAVGIKRRVGSSTDQDKLVNETFDKLGGNNLFGSTIGLFERELYLYALVFNVQAIITGVLVFKGFNAWLQAESKAGSAGEKPDAAANVPSIPPAAGTALAPSDAAALAPRDEMLAHYYGYTIGNLVSIAFALALFHMAKAAVVFIVQDMTASDLPRIVFGR
ncbi:MAG: hypothetical protein U0Q18_04545 [Bryobacteraceae bacterium]